MKFFLCLFLSVVVAVFGVQLYRLYQQRIDLSGQSTKLTTEASALDAENAKLRNDIEYFKQDENLSKEFRSKFNYHSPGEKMIILVPQE